MSALSPNEMMARALARWEGEGGALSPMNDPVRNLNLGRRIVSACAEEQREARSARPEPEPEPEAS